MRESPVRQSGRARPGRQAKVARFSRTLATLLGNGVTLLAGLSIVKETMGNAVLGASLEGVTARLREGKGFGRPLADQDHLRGRGSPRR